MRTTSRKRASSPSRLRSSSWVIAFGALVAAGIPLLLGLTAVFGTFGLVSLSSHFLPMAMQAPAVVLLIGLAVGVDYSMFYLRREREERAEGPEQAAAVQAAAATSGRSVLVSGLVVMTAMAGMFLTGNEIFASIALATIAVVAMAVLGSLTVLPALLSRFGDGVDRLRVRSSAGPARRRQGPHVGCHRRPGHAAARALGCRVGRRLGRPGHSRGPAAPGHPGPGDPADPSRRWRPTSACRRPFRAAFPPTSWSRPLT